MKKGFCLFLCLCIGCCFLKVPAMAAEEPDINTMQVSSLAGSNGVRYYNAETGEEKLISVDEYSNGSSLSVPSSPDLQEELPEIEPRHVIGTDTRTKVSNPTSQYQSTCLLGSRFSNTPDVVTPGTGWLINKNYVMTAGHMLYNSTYGYASHTAVYIGASGGTYKQYRLGHCYHVGEDYLNNCGATYYGVGMYDDWGIVKLDSPVSVSMSYLGRYGVNSASDMQNGRKYYTQGYPEDLNENAHSSWSAWDMYTTSGTITSNRTRFLDLVQTQMDIDYGQSGSPIYSYRTGLGYCAEGIVVGMSQDDSAERNFILLLNDWLMGYIYDNLT